MIVTEEVHRAASVADGRVNDGGIGALQQFRDVLWVGFDQDTVPAEVLKSVIRCHRGC